MILNTENAVLNTATRRKNKPTFAHAMFTGLALCSVSVVSQAVDSNNEEKPAFTIKIEDIEHTSETNEPLQITTVKAVEKDTSNYGTNLNRSIRLQDGGVVWVSQDPASLIPVLNVSAPNSVETENKKFTNPVNFKITTNYAYFIDSWALDIYHEDDKQLKKPIKTFTGNSLKINPTIKWDGSTSNGDTLQTGESFSYVLTVKDKKGHQDRTYPRKISLVGPQRNITQTDSSLSKSNLENNLELQTIPVHGSRVRIFGRDIPSDNSVVIDDKKISLVENKFVIEELLPSGKHDFNVVITDQNNNTILLQAKVKLAVI